MKLHYLIFSIAILSIPTLVIAESKNNAPPQKTITKWTCEEFAAIGEEFKANLEDIKTNLDTPQ